MGYTVASWTCYLRPDSKLSYLAAGIFLLGLVVNVSMSVTDPFVFVDTDILAQASSSSGSELTSWCKSHKPRNNNVCEIGSQGTGSVCIQKDCGGWFEPDCDCYATGWPQ